MTTQSDIHFELNLPVNAEQAYKEIGKVKDWWNRGAEGETSALGDSFTARFGDDFVRFEITEALPGRRYVWHVEGCFLDWLENKTEWTGTDVIFDITPTADGSTIKMLHRGLTPQSECYTVCNAGWERHVMTSLYKLVTEGTGTPKAPCAK